MTTNQTEAVEADGTEYPFAGDLDGVWHRRPANDTWTRDADTQCSTVCGAAIPSVNVSTFHPGELLEPYESLCVAGCFND